MCGKADLALPICEVALVGVLSIGMMRLLLLLAAGECRECRLDAIARKQGSEDSRGGLVKGIGIVKKEGVLRVEAPEVLGNKIDMVSTWESEVVCSCLVDLT